MNLRTFRAKSMADALAEVKKSFGPGAIILHTRTRNEGVRGRLGKSIVEITAAKDTFSLPPGSRMGRVSVGQEMPADRATGELGRAPVAGREVGNGAAPEGSPVMPIVMSTTVPSTVPTTMPSTKPVALAPQHDTPFVGNASVVAELAELKAAMRELASETRRERFGRLEPKWRRAVQTLIEARVAEDIAEGLARRLRSEIGADQAGGSEVISDRLRGYVASMLPAFDATPDGKYAPGKKVALVGATGVGKTTTVAKIAADARIRRGCDVAMITTDAYRIGAFEQLQLYAETIQAPLRLVSDEEGMKEAVAAFSGVDLLLIDTQGVSPHDTDGLGRLKSMLDAVGDGETHLVLAGNAADAALHDALRRFASLGVDHLIFSKLDEAVGLGVILNCLSRVNAKLSFVTNGQRVPNDLQAPRGRDVASWVVSGMSRL